LNFFVERLTSLSSLFSLKPLLETVRGFLQRFEDQAPLKLLMRDEG